MSYFQTIEFSDPAFERDALRFITVKSKHLKHRGDIVLYIPDGETINLAKIPLVILLHGVYGSAWSWAMKGGAHLTAKRLIQTERVQPMILAMPSDGLWWDGSGYSVHSGSNFERWIVEDVPMAVSELLSVKDYYPKLFIGGLSMGGYGSLRLGIKYAQLFAGISAHSSITEWKELELFSQENYGDISPPTDERKIIDLVSKYSGGIPPLRFDCGTEDMLLKGNSQLHQDLSRLGVNHIYDEFPGSHEWAYWQQHLVDSLLFFDELAKSQDNK